MRILFILNLFLIAINFAPNMAYSGDLYTFGGSCETNSGPWTQQALAQSDEIIKIVKELDGNEDCKALTNALKSIQAPMFKDEFADLRKNAESLPSEISALRSAVSSDSFSGGYQDKLLEKVIGKTIDSHKFTGQRHSAQVIEKRMKETMSHSINVINKLMDVIPTSEQCLFNRPDLVSTILGGSINLAATVSQAQYGGAEQIGNTVSRLVEFMQNRKYSKIIKSVSSEELRMSISCLMETTTDNYCNAKDAHEMLDYIEQENKLKKDIDKNEINHNPLEGYFLMSRDIPHLSKWLQKVQFGVEPKLNTDADYKNTVLENFNDLLQSQNRIIGKFNDQKLLYEALNSVESKRNNVLETLTDIVSLLGGGEVGRWGAAKGDINFFTRAIRSELIPFVLIGRDRIPFECSAKAEFPKNWRIFMSSFGDDAGFIPEFGDPDHLMRVIKNKLDEIIDIALQEGGSYYQQRLIIDLPNLIDQSLTSQTITNVERLKRIRHYILKIYSRVLKNEDGNDDVKLVSSMAQTIKILDRILYQYERLEERISNLRDIIDNDKSPMLVDLLGNDEEIKKIYVRILETIYREFNVILQRDTFLETRISEYVKYDYAYHVKSEKNMNAYQRDLLLVSGKLLISRLLANSYDTNPTMVRKGLSRAQMINKKNLEAVEDLFGDYLIPTLADIKRISRGKNNSDFAYNLDKWSRFAEDSMNPTFGLMRPIYNWYRHSERYNSRPIDFDKTYQSEDMYGSFEDVLSQFCIQTLSFERKHLYYDLCKDTTLRSSFGDDPNANLEVSYSDYMVKYIKAKKTKKRVDILKNRDENICAYRNYKRRNKAYWLLKNPSY